MGRCKLYILLNCVDGCCFECEKKCGNKRCEKRYKNKHECKYYESEEDE